MLCAKIIVTLRFFVFVNIWFKDSRTELPVILGAIYTAVMLEKFNNFIIIQPVVVVERTVFYREIAAGMSS